MKIDLHIHSKEGSDGWMSLSEIFKEADKRKIRVISITDHDSIEGQGSADALAARYGIHYIPGVELNISFSHPRYCDGKVVSLDLLGYQFDIHDQGLAEKLDELRKYREQRAEQILEKINEELAAQSIKPFTHKDLEAIEETVEGAFGRPHIADYMVKKKIVSNRQEAFDKYLVKCNMPKMPLSLQEASSSIKAAGGRLVLAHPNDPNGTSLRSLTSSLEEQHQIIRENMLTYVDGVECWHSRHDRETVSAYLSFARHEGLMVTGGSDCHQQPLIMGTLDVPPYVAEQFGYNIA
jgi:predicted metal-dependent phosphoesterase TrpH